MNEALKPSDLQVPTLGTCQFESPLQRPGEGGGGLSDFVSEAARVLLAAERLSGAPGTELAFEKAGPRQRIYFDPAATRAGIVTCGGLCPGINSVIRSLVLELHHRYGVRDIVGFRFGYEGLNPDRGLSPIALSPGVVEDIHRKGGSILGLGRGAQDPAVIVARLAELGVNILLVVGGDGTLKGARAIADCALRRRIPLSVVGVPKAIDNDIPFVDQAFGFETAVQVAAQALNVAHTEATSARNGVGVVKLMGREAGFICAHAALSSLDVNFCLIPEVPFDLDGKGGLFEALETRLLERGHAVIAIAEGCKLAPGQVEGERDVSGNLRFANRDLDAGPPLCDALRAHFKAKAFSMVVKYIDPSYMIRSVATNASDDTYCDLLARHAVHAAMAGKTSMVVGHWNGSFTHVPLALSTTRRKRVDGHSELWLAVKSMTGQPSLCRTRPGTRGAEHMMPTL